MQQKGRAKDGLEVGPWLYACLLPQPIGALALQKPLMRSLEWKGTPKWVVVEVLA